MRTIGLLLLTALAACSSKPRLPRAPEGEPVLEVRGAIKDGPHALGRADLERLPRLTIRGEEPRSGKAEVWEGTSVAALVSEQVQLRKGTDTAIVRTADGAAVPVPLTMVRQLKPVLADRADGERLRAPVLAWPTEEQKALATDPRAASWWARGVVAFELVDWQRTYGPALAAPAGSTDAARRGADLFATSCIVCHRMRGVGGERGPELTTVAARLAQDAFVERLLLPGHPGWERAARDLPRELARDDLWTFLRAVAVTSGPSGEEPGEERERDEEPEAAPPVTAAR